MSWLGFLGLGGTGYEKHQEYPERITEAACDDLVQSLMRLGFIPKMIPSLDGKEYWTSEHLGQMIVARLAKLGGRLSILELPRMLNVELSSARDVIQDLLRSQPGKFVQVQEDLLEIDYLVNITREMNSELDQRGFLTTVEQSKRYNLGLDYMRQFLKDRVGSQIHGTWDTVDQGFVYAGWFKTQQKAALLKLLCELDEPTTLATLRARRVVHDQFFFGLCDALVKEEASALPGTIKGWHDQGIFVPRQFVKHQASSIESFFDQNGFIAFESVTKHGVSDPKNYIRKLRPNALLLETHAVQESIWSVVDASVEDAITSVSWVDIKGDLASLLAQLPSLTHPHSRPSPPATDRDDGGEGVTGFGGVGSPYDTFILQDRAVLTSGQIQKCMLEMGPLLDNTLKAVMSWRLSFGSLGLVLDDHVEENSEAGSGGGVTSSDQHREQIQQVISQKGRKDRIKMVSPSLSKSKGKGSSSDLLVGSGGSATNQKKKRLDDFLTLADIIAELKTTEPDLEPMLAEAIARALHRPLLLQLKEKNRHLVIDQAEERGIDEPAEQHSGDIVNKQATKLLEHILQTLDKIAAFAKGVELFEDSSAMNSLSKYLLQSICSELLPLYILLISYTSLPSDQAANSLQERLLQQYWTSSSNISEPSAQHQPPQPFTIEGADLVALEQVLPPPQMDMAKKWRKCVTGSGKWKSLDELCKTLQVRPITVFEQERQQKDHGETSSSTSASSPSSSGPLSSFSDRKPKILRTHLDDLRATLIDLDQVASKALLVHVVTLIVFQAWTGEMLHASGKYVPRILKQLHVTVAATSTTEGKEENAKDERGEALAKLEQLMQVVMEEVKSGGAVTSTEDATTLCQSIFDYGLRMTSRG
ncbi:E3 UFM1-protein ligase 1 [Actinomortierella ambigua]|uniref:E3 UFM1-protein ligase 1 n=1 Tax=Actinomortierella ambigua TaxID=1343610 RepID=A0A9P6QJ82_9FUNG|nr:E3 UFM1-protein ligase 1 [Actinomortierella ambigua]